MFLLAVATLSHKVLWNSPWPSYCNQSVVDPQPDFSKFGVTANANNFRVASRRPRDRVRSEGRPGGVRSERCILSLDY